MVRAERKSKSRVRPGVSQPHSAGSSPPVVQLGATDRSPGGEGFTPRPRPSLPPPVLLNRVGIYF